MKKNMLKPTLYRWPQNAQFAQYHFQQTKRNS